MTRSTFRRYARYMPPTIAPAIAGESSTAERLIPLRRDLLPACAALMLDGTTRKHAGQSAMTLADALRRLEICFDHDHAVGVALLNTRCQPVAFALGHVERDERGTPTHICLREFYVAARARRSGLGAWMIEFLRQQCDGAPIDFDARAGRWQMSEWINML